MSDARSWTVTVGGLSEVAVDAGERYILAVSPSGRGLYALDTGERIARDREEPRFDSDWLDETGRRVRGIGPLESHWLDAVGLWGGAFETQAGDRRLSVTGDPAAQQAVVLHLAAGDRTLDSGIVTEIRVLGFLRGGRTIVIATSSDLSVFDVPVG